MMVEDGKRVFTWFGRMEEFDLSTMIHACSSNGSFTTVALHFTTLVLVWRTHIRQFIGSNSLMYLDPQSETLFKISASWLP